MTVKELVVSLIGFQFTLIVALAVLIGRLRERITRLEEWQRLSERRSVDS
jgi:hypothetical protein